MKKHITNFIAVFLALVITFNLVACSSKKEDKDTDDITIELVGTGDADSPYASDALKTITINDLNVNEINVVSIDPKDVVVKGINVEEIKSIELQVVPLNDEMVTLAYENFKSVYGEDIDVGKLIANVAVGTVCVVVYVVLSVYGGPLLSEFFGMVMVEEFTAISLAVGAAIDAAISGFQAYQEGGDASYIIGHMINGVAEGFMWGAILAPLSAGFSQGIKGCRAIKALKKIPSFSKFTEKQALQLLNNLPDFLREAGRVSSAQTDEAIIKIYEKLSSELREKIPKELFVSMVKNKESLIYIAKTIDPMGLSAKVVEALRTNFWDGLDNVSDDVVKETIKKIQNGTIKNLDDITNKEIKDYIIQNSVDFIKSHSDKLSDEFVENWLVNNLGNGVYSTIKYNVASTDGLITISKEVGYKELTKILKRSENYELLVSRFGKENIEKMREVAVLYRYITNQSNDLSDDFVNEIINSMFKKGLDLSKINDPNIAIVTENPKKYSEPVSQSLKNLGLDQKNSKLLNELAINSLSYIEGVSNEMAEDIVLSGMGKETIISKYGKEVWKQITANSYSSITRFNIAPNVNMTLIRDIAFDSLLDEGIPEDVIELILRGESYVTWNLSEEKIVSIAGVVSEYYRASNPDLYKTFIFNYAEMRGRNIADAVAKYQETDPIINCRYAGGVMVPAGDNADYILEKYGEIRMSEQGFAIFDEYAIARVVLEGLTGNEDEDIRRANILHHGSPESIPGYTWHHLEDGKTLILIPTDLHQAYPHTGGAALLRKGLI